MKIRVELIIEEDDNYEDYIRPGILFNKEWECIYYEMEVFHIPIEGQTVSTKFGMCKVKWTCFNLDDVNDPNDWFDITRVAVRQM